MSTGPERNPRGVRVWQRDAAGEIIPEREGGASPNALFAQTFATIANGLHALPENIVEAVRALPERHFPPPWIFWLLVYVIRQVARDRFPWEYLRAHCPIRMLRDGSGIVTVDPSLDSEGFQFAFFLFDAQASAIVNHFASGLYTEMLLRFEPVNACEVLAHVWEEPALPHRDDLARNELAMRVGIVPERLQALIPEASWDQLLTDLVGLQLIVFHENSETFTAIRGFDRVVLNVYSRDRDDRWRPFLAALAGDWLLLEDLAAAANDQELLAEAHRRADLFLRTWLENPRHVVGEWEVFDTVCDWRGLCLALIRSRGAEYFRQQLQPYLRDLHWIAEWGDALPPFCDEGWEPDLWQVIERLINTPRHRAALACIEHLLQAPGQANTVIQRTTNIGILVGERWEELAFLLLALAPELAMPLMERALALSQCHALLPFLAVVDAEWSRRLLQRSLQECRSRSRPHWLRVLFALSQSRHSETAEAASREIVEITHGRGLRGRKRQNLVQMINSVRSSEESYRTQPLEAGRNLARAIADHISHNSDLSWAMTEASGRRLLDRLVANRLADVAAPSTGEEP